jgi:hypothetical protein
MSLPPRTEQVFRCMFVHKVLNTFQCERLSWLDKKATTPITSQLLYNTDTLIKSKDPFSDKCSLFSDKCSLLTLLLSADNCLPLDPYNNAHQIGKLRSNGLYHRKWNTNLYTKFTLYQFILICIPNLPSEHSVGKYALILICINNNNNMY